MGNRSWLYLRGGTPPHDGIVEIAEANNHFPTLWKVMLAGGESGAPIDHQRVFGDAGTSNLVADARPAIARLKSMAAFAARHPLAARHPAVVRQFAGAAHWLEETVALARDEPGDVIQLSANLDELSWFDGGSRDGQFIAEMRAECDACWAAVQQALQDGSATRFDAALGLRRWDDRDLWAWDFGFGSLDHAYFDGDKPPSLLSYAEFEAQELDDDDDHAEDFDEGDDREAGDDDPGDDEEDEPEAESDTPGPVRDAHGWGVRGVDGRMIVPCRHAWLAPVGDDGKLGWLVADPMAGPVPDGCDDPMRMGVLRPDGSVLVAQDFAWIASRDVGDGGFGYLPPHCLAKAWAAGKPAVAARWDADGYRWLHADGREQSDIEHARERRVAGDRAAAEAFATRLRDGDGMAPDLVAAREWFAFASGAPDGSDLRDASTAHAAGRVSAICQLAPMLRDGVGGPADPAAARAWLQLALQRGGKRDHEVHAQLGYLHVKGLGGARDFDKARHHFGIGAREGSTRAAYSLGLMCKAGEGAPVDLAAAERHFRDGDARGNLDASHQLGDTLSRQAEADDETADGPRWREAAHYLRKVAEQDDARLRAHAALALARLHLRGALAGDGVRQARPWLAVAIEQSGDDADVRGDAVDLLVDRVLGPPDSPLHDAAEARRWRAEIAPAGPPEPGAIASAGLDAVSRLLGRLFGRK